MIDLTGKFAVVTGGASGIGRAGVKRLAAAGSVVFSGDVDDTGNSQTLELCKGLRGFVIPSFLDISDRSVVNSYAQEVMGEVGKNSSSIDILVNVAGWDRIQPFLDATPEFMDKVLDINLKGPINVATAFLPGMIEVNAGKIINISKERTIDVMITRLRQKIESNPKNPKYLQTIRGSGYVLWIK